METSPRLCYVGHSTVLIELDGVRLLTDPVLCRRIGPLSRQCPPVAPSLYADIDAVLLSHLHLDHFHPPSLRLLPPEVRLIVPAGAASAIQTADARQVEELRAGETTSIGPLTVRATPALHSGYRFHPAFGPEAGCLGFVIEGSRQIYFAGDTALFPEMAALGDNLDLALLPVWGWGPNLGEGHMDPAAAAEALTMLRPRQAVPIHWGTFYPFGLRLAHPTPLHRPPHEFARLAADLAPDVAVNILQPGESLPLSQRGSHLGIDKVALGDTQGIGQVSGY